MAKLNIGFGAFEKTKHKGKVYKKIKTFKNEQKAEEFANKLEKKMKSKRYFPIIERVPIGLGIGWIYRVCIPKDMEI